MDDIKYRLIRSNRKTLELRVTKDGIVVRAPYNCPTSKIEDFIKLKWGWLEKNIAKVQKYAAIKNTYKLDYDSKLMYRGNRYPIVASEKYGFEDMFFIPPDLPEAAIRLNCENIYKYLAKLHFNARVKDFAKIMGVQPTAVKVNSAKRRWGSCSTEKSINFSWRLVMASDEVIDYVIVHELAHILEMNHSAEFWAIVELVIPDYMARRNKLKEYAKIFTEEGWG